MRSLKWVLLSAAFVSSACGGPKGTSSPQQSSDYLAGYNPDPPAQGFTRFVGPVIDGIQPGEDQTWCQYVSAPFDHDLDVIYATGGQSKYGHHVIAYGTTKALPVGTSRPCVDADSLSVAYLGGAGGEGVTQNVTLPKNIGFRLHKGEAIMLNTHFINTSNQAISGQGYVDLKLSDPDPSRTIASVFSNVGTTFTVPAGTTGAHDANCTIGQDIQLILAGNHMHQWGATVFTEVKRTTGETEMIHRDDSWKAEYQFNPPLTYYPDGEFLQLHKGDVVHTRCEWTNTLATDISFPQEMCVGFGYYAPATVEIDCVDGDWPAAN